MDLTLPATARHTASKRPVRPCAVSRCRCELTASLCGEARMRGALHRARAENNHVNHDRRRKTPRPAPKSWLGRAIYRWGSVLLLLIAFAVVLFGVAAGDNQSRDLAQNVAEHGQWATSTNVQVHVSRFTDKSGTYWGVDAVRVVLPDEPNAVTLQGAQFGDDLPENYPEGWQAPNRLTGFTAPLQVRVLHNIDGTIDTAMAAKDVTYWTRGNHLPEWEALSGTGCLALAALIMFLNARRHDPTRTVNPNSPMRRRTRAWGDWFMTLGKASDDPRNA